MADLTETNGKKKLIIEDDIDDYINTTYDCICSNPDPRLVLLKEKEVIQWLFGDLSFLPEIEKKNKTSDKKILKTLEDTWGQNILKKRRPDLKLDKQWTNRFGEHLCEELCILQGKEYNKPVNKEHFQPDLEINDYIIEAKTQTFYTEGTAGEKIMGCPVKYSRIPNLYSKPLKILCIGGAEDICRNKYGILPGPKCCNETNIILECYKNLRIEFIGVTDILKGLFNNS